MAGAELPEARMVMGEESPGVRIGDSPSDHPTADAVVDLHHVASEEREGRIGF